MYNFLRRPTANFIMNSCRKSKIIVPGFAFVNNVLLIRDLLTYVNFSAHRDEVHHKLNITS